MNLRPVQAEPAFCPKSAGTAPRDPDNNKMLTENRKWIEDTYPINICYDDHQRKDQSNQDEDLHVSSSGELTRWQQENMWHSM